MSVSSRLICCPTCWFRTAARSSQAAATERMTCTCRMRTCSPSAPTSAVARWPPCALLADRSAGSCVEAVLTRLVGCCCRGTLCVCAGWDAKIPTSALGAGPALLRVPISVVALQGANLSCHLQQLTEVRQVTEPVLLETSLCAPAGNTSRALRSLCPAQLLTVMRAVRGVRTASAAALRRCRGGWRRWQQQRSAQARSRQGH